ncbi:aldehyde dehydrogenase family protein, partial [Pseudomonas aeruginosa]|uniref:aldehyde dehydrogenase family protein n=1 Tax=Pseudomonas aeruginosa TaxID=287 RepID=UPI001F542F71
MVAVGPHATGLDPAAHAVGAVDVAGPEAGAEALAIANDTEYGLGPTLWTRDINRAYRMGRGIKAGRVWTNCYH